MSLPPPSSVFTVSRLNTSVRQLLEREMGQVWLSAEISNLSQPASGHWYFTLKDDSAQVRCAMFRNSNRRVTFCPQHGQQVLVRATITLYEPRGDYQLIAESMHPAGEGLLQQQYEQLKLRLSAEGLFDAACKKPLPVPARRVGVITSSTGAALHDVLRILHRRDPSLPVIVYPTPVQGAEAPASIVRAIELANLRDECDVLIVGRGGGSLEDLWSFNDERVARAIFASRLPVISAVGHEIDVTIADFVADLRASTPSAAAELVSRNQIELVRQMQSQQQRLGMAMDFYLAHQNQSYTRLHHLLQQQHPQLRLARQQSTLLQLQRRLINAIQHRLNRIGQQHENTIKRLSYQQTLPRIVRLQQRLQHQRYQLIQAIGQRLNDRRQQFATLAGQLEGVSPLATLARGFSVTTTNDNQIVKKVRQLKAGDVLKTRLDDGWVESQVTKLHRVRIKKLPAG